MRVAWRREGRPTKPESNPFGRFGSSLYRANRGLYHAHLSNESCEICTFADFELKLPGRGSTHDDPYISCSMDSILHIYVYTYTYFRLPRFHSANLMRMSLRLLFPSDAFLVDT